MPRAVWPLRHGRPCVEIVPIEKFADIEVVTMIHNPIEGLVERSESLLAI